MAERSRGWALGAGAAALALLAGCGPSPRPAAAPANAVSSAPGQGPAPAILALPPAIDPEHDSRPDRVKFDDFAGRLEAIQANLTQIDAAFIGRVRTSLQPGSDAGAKAALADYRAQIAADIAGQPPPPRLAGCFARAQSLNVKAEAAVAALLSARRDKASAVAAVADRPLTLPDFGALAVDISTGAAADEARSDLAAAKGSVAGCRDAPAAPLRLRASGPARPSAPGQPAQNMSVQNTPAPAPQPQAPPPKKPGLFQRLFGGG